MSLLLVCDSVRFSSNSSIILCDNNNIVNTAKTLHNITFLSFPTIPNDVFNSIFIKLFNSTFKRLNVTLLAKMQVDMASLIYSHKSVLLNNLFH